MRARLEASRRASSLLAGGVAIEERPRGRSRWNRTITSTGMGRVGAQHGLRGADKLRGSGCCVLSHATDEQSGNRAPSARETRVPPRGFEPQPTSFAALCPVLGTVATRKRSGRSGGNRTPRSSAPNERIVRVLGRRSSSHQRSLRYPWRELHPRTRVERPVNYCCSTRTNRRAKSLELGGANSSCDAIAPALLLASVETPTSSGHAMSCGRSLVETACCFARWVAPVRYLRPVIVTVTNYHSARVAGSAGIEPASFRLTNGR